MVVVVMGVEVMVIVPQLEMLVGGMYMVVAVKVGMWMVHHPIHFQGTLAHQSQTHHQEWGSLVVNERWWVNER